MTRQSHTFQIGQRGRILDGTDSQLKEVTGIMEHVFGETLLVRYSDSTNSNVSSSEPASRGTGTEVALQ
jgi:hypothetical protein